jgi:hypothetical protein
MLLSNSRELFGAYLENSQMYYFNFTPPTATGIHSIINNDADLKQFHITFLLNMHLFLLQALDCLSVSVVRE